MHAVVRIVVLFCTLTAAATPLPAETTALALSGGGARGFALIGVLQALQDEQLEPDLIVGSSMGAVIGGLWAAGYSAEQIRAIALTTDWSGLFLDRPARRNLFLGKKETNARHVLNLRFRGWAPEVPLGFTTGQQITELLFDLVQRAPYAPLPSFDDLRVPFRAVATDLVSGKAVVFDRGDLAEAMRASLSLPLVFQPYRLDSLLLVDGGVIENIPVDVARAQGATHVVAVDLTTGFAPHGDLELPWDLADRVTTIMHTERNRESRAEADVVLTPDIGAHKSSDFGEVDSLIASGYRAARYHMDRLTRVLRRTDDHSATPPRTSFCSRAAYARFRAELAPAALPPNGYRYYGAHAFADSIINRLPAGAEGLTRLALLRQTYVDNGRTLAHATDLRLDSARTLHSTWQEGRIRSIAVRGQRRYDEDMILREFPLANGQFFDLRRAKRGIAQVYGSDLFESVTLSVVNADSGADLTIRVRERQSPQMRFGAGFSLERKGRGFAEFLNDNVLGIGGRLELFGKYGEMDEEAAARLRFDRVPFSTPVDAVLQSSLTTEIRASWLREEYSFYTPMHDDTAFYFFERTGAELWIGRAFRRWGEVSGGARYEGVRAGGVLDEPTAQINYVGTRAIVDTKDRYPFPTSGFSWNGRYEYAFRSRQAGRAFNRTQATADVFVPLARRWVSHARANWAWNDRLLPLWGQFALGGERGVLGLHTAERYGSTRLTVLTELRYDLLSRWAADAYISAIYTVGAVSHQSQPLPNAADYLHGLGGSFSLATFLGPMTLTVGELLKSNFGTGQTVVYLNLGHEF